MEKNAIITNIVNAEWEMFQHTHNIGGRAWCQDDRQQFDANRYAQFEAWDEASCRAYWQDIQTAGEKDVNLVSLKYAYMMQDTAPEEYAAMQDILPVISPEKMALVNQLVEITIHGAEAFAAQYPHIARGGRPIRRTDAAPGLTSVETYSRGELATYSENTLLQLYSHYRSSAAAHVNLYEQIVGSELRRLYGLPLKDLEQKLAESSRGF